jgi:hypothetical protein
VLAEESDYNQFYERALTNIRNRNTLAHQAGIRSSTQGNAEKMQAAKDYYANVRTNVSSLHCEMC